MIGGIRNASDWAGLDVRHLDALVAVAQEGSVTRAAERLGYTQSAVSQQIQALERITGAELLSRVRGARGVELTEAGRRLVRHADAIRAQVAEARDDLAAAVRADQGIVRVGSVPSVARLLVAPIATALQAEAARIVLHIEESYQSDVLLERLRSGELDLVFAPIVDDLPGIETTGLLRDGHVLAVPAGDPLAALDRPLEPRDLAGRRVVSKDCGTPSQRAIEAALARLDVATETVVRAHDGATVQALVAAGVGVAIMPRLLTDPGDSRVVLVPADHLVPDRVLGVHVRRERPMTVERVLAAAVGQP
jgi:molybdate transport repressor ModE-like protein